MKKLAPKRSVIAIIVLVIALSLVVYFKTSPRLAPGQAPLADLQNIQTLRTAFNRDAGKTRLIILVSPT